MVHEHDGHRSAVNAWRGIFPHPLAAEIDFSRLDPGIAYFVRVLAEHGVETYESCQGGSGHAYPEPTIRFHGVDSEGFRAVALALEYDLPVMAIKRIWTVVDREPTGPDWEMTFWRLGEPEKPSEPSGRTDVRSGSYDCSPEDHDLYRSEG